MLCSNCIEEMGMKKGRVDIDGATCMNCGHFGVMFYAYTRLETHFVEIAVNKSAFKPETQTVHVTTRYTDGNKTIDHFDLPMEDLPHYPPQFVEKAIEKVAKMIFEQGNGTVTEEQAARTAAAGVPSACNYGRTGKLQPQLY